MCVVEFAVVVSEGSVAGSKAAGEFQVPVAADGPAVAEGDAGGEGFALVADAVPFEVVAPEGCVVSHEGTDELGLSLAAGSCPAAEFESPDLELVGSRVMMPHVPRCPVFGHEAPAVAVSERYLQFEVGRECEVEQEVGLECKHEPVWLVFLADGCALHDGRGHDRSGAFHVGRGCDGAFRADVVDAVVGVSQQGQAVLEQVGEVFRVACAHPTFARVGRQVAACDFEQFGLVGQVARVGVLYGVDESFPVFRLVFGGHHFLGELIDGCHVLGQCIYSSACQSHVVPVRSLGRCPSFHVDALEGIGGVVDDLIDALSDLVQFLLVVVEFGVELGAVEREDDGHSSYYGLGLDGRGCLLACWLTSVGRSLFVGLRGGCDVVAGIGLLQIEPEMCIVHPGFEGRALHVGEGSVAALFPDDDVARIEETQVVVPLVAVIDHASYNVDGGQLHGVVLCHEPGRDAEGGSGTHRQHFRVQRKIDLNRVAFAPCFNLIYYAKRLSRCGAQCVEQQRE